MISATPIWGNEPPTGMSIQAWLAESYSDRLTGQSAQLGWVHYTLYSQQSEVSPYVYVINTVATDPGASHRAREIGLADWSRNLAHLTTTAKAVIPGLRDLTPPERKNLRQYYRTLYRKA